MGASAALEGSDAGGVGQDDGATGGENLAAASVSFVWLAMAHARVASTAVVMIARWLSSRLVPPGRC